MNAATWVELAALALAVWAARLSLPQAPSFDAERLFKFALANALRGEMERAGADLAAWRASVLGHVLYHPSVGPEPERLLERPDAAILPVPPPPGARALVEQLSALPDELSRRRWLYEEDPLVEAALLGHPDELGPDYDPAPRFSPGVGWDALAAWTDPVLVSLRRRFDAAVLVELGGGYAQDLASAIPGLRCATVRPEGLEDAAFAAAIVAVAQRPADRLILVGEGASARRAIGALASSAALRDRLMTLVAVGGDFGAPGSEPRGALQAQFTHEVLDPEVHRTLPYLTLLDGAAPLASWPHQRLPTPPAPVTGRLTIDLLDLGPLDLDGLSRSALARALWVVLAWRLG